MYCSRFNVGCPTDNTLYFDCVDKIDCLPSMFVASFVAFLDILFLFRLGADDGRAMPTGDLFSSTFALKRGYK